MLSYVRSLGLKKNIYISVMSIVLISLSISNFVSYSVLKNETEKSIYELTFAKVEEEVNALETWFEIQNQIITGFANSYDKDVFDKNSLVTISRVGKISNGLAGVFFWV